MNKGRWDGLPDNIKAAFIEASGCDWWGEVGDIWRASDDFGINLAVENGNTHVTLTEEETGLFRDAMAPVVDRWVEEVTAKGIDGAGLVEKARAGIAAHASDM